MKYKLLLSFCLLSACVKTNSTIPTPSGPSSVPPPDANTFLMKVTGLSSQPYSEYSYSVTVDGGQTYVSNTGATLTNPVCFVVFHPGPFGIYHWYTLIFRTARTNYEFGISELTTSINYNNSPDIHPPNTINLPSPDPGDVTQIGVNLTITSEDTKKFSGTVSGSGMMEGKPVSYSCRFTNMLKPIVP